MGDSIYWWDKFECTLLTQDCVLQVMVVMAEDEVAAMEEDVLPLPALAIIVEKLDT